MYEDLHGFLIFAGGWLSLGVGVLLQANYKHINTVLSWIIIILGACLIQNLSNYLAKVYGNLFKFLDKEQGVLLATTEHIKMDGRNKSNAQELTTLSLIKFRSLMQFIGWSRLFISLTVVFHIILIVSLGKETAASSPVQSLHDGRILYFAFAFFVANCFYDLLYETLPYVFSQQHAQIVRMYTIYAYVLYLNLTQLMYLFVNTSAKWDKTLTV